MTDASTTIGAWSLDHEIGRGGMGTVWAARRDGDRRLFALKILHEHRAESEALVRRFLREADAARRVRHEGVVTIHDIAEEDGRHYLVMDLVPGRSLDDHLRAVERDPAAASRVAGDPEAVSHRDRRYVIAVARLFAGAARALAALHAEGIVHRDVKPANLLLHEDGRLVITDFGIARAVDAETMTITGDVLGTPLYLAPERIRNRGRDVDQRTDVYSLGVAMYQMLALAAPFRGDTLPELVEDIERGAPVPLRDRCAWISASLSAVVDRAMARRPADRYPDASALADDLDAFVAGGAVRARGPSPLDRARRALRRRPELRHALVAAIAVFIVGAAAYGWVRVDDARRLRQRHDDVVAEARRAIERGAWGSAWRAAQEAERLRSDSPDAAALKDEVVARASDAVAAAAARGGADLLAAAGMSRMIASFDPTHEAVKRMRSSVGGAFEAEVRRRAGRGEVDDVERLLAGGEDLPIDEPARAGIAAALDRAAGRAVSGFDYASAAVFMALAARLKREGTAGSAPWQRPGFELLQEIVDGVGSADPVLRAEALRKLDEPRSWALLPRDETVRFVRATLPRLEGRELVRLIGTIGGRRLHEAVPELIDLEPGPEAVRAATRLALARLGREPGASSAGVEGGTPVPSEAAQRLVALLDRVRQCLGVRETPPKERLADVCRALGALAPRSGWNQTDRVTAARELLRVADATGVPAHRRAAAWDALGRFTDAADLVVTAAAVKAVADPDVMTAAALCAARLKLGAPPVRPRAVADAVDAWRACRVEALAGRAEAAVEWLERAITMGFEDAAAVRAAPELAAIDAARIEAILAVLE